MTDLFYDIGRDAMVKMSPERHQMFSSMEIARRKNVAAQGGPPAPAQSPFQLKCVMDSEWIRAILDLHSPGVYLPTDHLCAAYGTDDLNAIAFEHGWFYDIDQDMMVKMSPETHKAYRACNFPLPRPVFVTMQHGDPDGGLISLPPAAPEPERVLSVFPAQALTLPSISGKPEWPGGAA